MTLRRVRFGRQVVLAASTIALSGCPVPANYTTATSAPVSGRVVWDDGTPARDVPIVLATEWARTPCGKAALRTTTDATGSFALEGLSQHHSVMWFVPNLDIVAPRFDVCAGVGDTLRHMYTGIGSLRAIAESASVSCTLVRWQGTAHGACNDRVRQDVIVGGHWRDSTRDGREGLYRLLLTEQPTQVRGYDKGYLVDRPYVYVQWIEQSGDSASAAPRFRIDSTLSLGLDRNKVTAIDRVQLWRREGRWMVSLEGYKKSFMNDFDRAELIFALGAPGEATRVAGP